MVRVSADPRIKVNHLIGQAKIKLQISSGKVIIRAYGNAISRAVLVTELIKDSVGWLFQTTRTYTVAL